MHPCIHAKCVHVSPLAGIMHPCFTTCWDNASMFHRMLGQCIHASMRTASMYHSIQDWWIHELITECIHGSMGTCTMHPSIAALLMCEVPSYDSHTLGGPHTPLPTPCPTAPRGSQHWCRLPWGGWGSVEWPCPVVKVRDTCQQQWKWTRVHQEENGGEVGTSLYMYAV